MTFGEKFKAEREKRKLTQQEVADALGINRRMITRYENGISFPRTKDAYRKIAEYFKVDVNYLLTEDEATASTWIISPAVIFISSGVITGARMVEAQVIPTEKATSPWQR